VIAGRGPSNPRALRQVQNYRVLSVTAPQGPERGNACLAYNAHDVCCIRAPVRVCGS